MSLGKEMYLKLFCSTADIDPKVSSNRETTDSRDRYENIIPLVPKDEDEEIVEATGIKSQKEPIH